MKVLAPTSELDRTRQIQKEIAGKFGIDLVFEDEAFDSDSINIILANHLNMGKLGTYVKKFSSVKMIQTLSAGVDRINFTEIPNDILLCSNAGAYSVPVAEHAVAMGIALAKNLMESDRSMKKGQFVQRGNALKLHGSRALVVGYGGIGSHVGMLCEGMGMDVTGIGRSANEKGRNPIATLRDLNQFLPESDIVFITTPLNNATRNLFNGDRLNLMKERAVLVNVARAEIVVQKALYDHLVKNTQFKAGIDTWWNEPWGKEAFVEDYPISALPNVLCSPHNSGMVEGMHEVALNRAFENIRRYQSGEKAHNVVKREDYL